MHTAVETSGFSETAAFKKVVETADLILFDIKHMDPRLHEYWTGTDNSLILKNLDCLICSGKTFTARMPLIPGVNDTEENFALMARCLERARDRCRLEILPYNRLAGAKYESVSRKYEPGFDADRAVHFRGDEFDKRGIKWKVL